MMTLRFTVTLLAVLASATSLAADLKTRGPRYLLQPGDIFETDYRYTPEYNQSVTVEPDGYASLKLIGHLKVEGMTVDQVHDAILALVSKRLNDPELVINLKEFLRPYYVVTGEVTHPNRYDLRGETTVLQAIAVAGGFTPSAKHSQVVLFRKVDEQTAETRVLDIKALMKKPNVEQNVQLREGDILLVPTSNLSKIERFVKLANIGMFINPF